jgi:seryl-tRNA synthetase
MLDIKLIRENPDLMRKNLERRHDPEYLTMFNELLRVDEQWRKAVTELNKLRRKLNKVNADIAKLKKQRKKTDYLITQAKDIAGRIKSLQAREKLLKDRQRALLMRIPNLLHESVPFGKDENDNVEIRRWGKPPKFNFKPKSHLEILKNLGMVDFERGAKVAGSQFYYLKGDVVYLDLAIQRFALDFLKKKGFQVVEPPLMINRKAYEGMIDFADFEMVTYKIENEDLYLIATAEHPLGAMFMNETFNKKDLPLRLAGVSPCFRKEVGAHGKYTKGLFRVHHFNKIEQFVFSHPDDSWDLHEELQQNSEKLYQKLGLHYRVVNICTGDIGTIAAKKYDIECWMADGKFRETGSNSNCTDYQARRLNIKWREGPGKPPAGYVHTLNNTALATSRTMIAIIEQNQQKDGSVKIPKVLWKYTGFRKLKKE